MSESFWRGKTVVVTGGLGFIGSHFVEELLRQNANVICLYHNRISHFPSYGHGDNLAYHKVDLGDYNDLKKFSIDFKEDIDVFIHCAAIDGNTRFKQEHSAEIFDTNNRFVSNILKICKNRQVPHVALLSSAEIYSSDKTTPLTEEDDYRKYPISTGNGYVLSKVFSEALADLYERDYGMHTYTIRPTNVYGPRDNFSLEKNRVIPSIINKVSRGENVEIWGDGKQTRSFTYVKDLVKTTLIAIEKKATGPLNVATKWQTSILDLVSCIAAECGVKSHITLDKSKPTGAKNRVLDVSKMCNIIDFVPLGIDEGLKLTIKWYANNTKNKANR